LSALKNLTILGLVCSICKKSKGVDATFIEVVPITEGSSGGGEPIATTSLPEIAYVEHSMKSSTALTFKIVTGSRAPVRALITVMFMNNDENGAVISLVRAASGKAHEDGDLGRRHAPPRPADKQVAHDDKDAAETEKVRKVVGSKLLLEPIAIGDWRAPRAAYAIVNEGLT
jgi:hypothetical protein